MTQRTFTIQLKVDLGDETERYEPMKTIVLQYGRDLLAHSTLLADGRKPPTVVAFTEDAFFTTEEIKILPTDTNGEIDGAALDQIAAELAETVLSSPPSHPDPITSVEHTSAGKLKDWSL